MKEYFKSQLDEVKTPYLWYFIISGDLLTGINLDMKSIKKEELDSFDFSELEFFQIKSDSTSRSLPIFKVKGV